MDSGFDQNVATAMPRSGRGGQPRTPWDVTPPPSEVGGRHDYLAGARGARRPPPERGKSDVLEKIRELKSELEASFAAREELQNRVDEEDGEIRRLRSKNDALQENLEEQRKDASFQREEKEAAVKRVKELEDLLQRERTVKDELRGELSEARLALDEINAALQ